MVINIKHIFREVNESMLDLEILHDRVQENTNGNKRLLEDIFNRDTQSIYVVYSFDKYGTEILKAFILKRDATEYQRYYQMTSYKMCEIKEIDLE